TTTVAGRAAATRFSRTNGVRPIISVTFAAIRAITASFYRDIYHVPAWLLERRMVSTEGYASGKDNACVGACTRSALATSTHVNSLDLCRWKWQASLPRVFALFGPYGRRGCGEGRGPCD